MRMGFLFGLVLAKGDGGWKGRCSSLSIPFHIFHECPTSCSFHRNGWKIKKKKKGLLSANDVITNSETQLSNPFLKTFGSHSGEDGIAWRFSRC